MAPLFRFFCKLHNPLRHPAHLDDLLIRRRHETAAGIHDIYGPLHLLGRCLIKLVDLIFLQHKELGIEPRTGKRVQNPAHTGNHLVRSHIPLFRPAEEIILQGLPVKHGQLRPVRGAHADHDPFEIISLEIRVQEIIHFLVISVDGADSLAFSQRVSLQKVVIEFIDIPLLFDGPAAVILSQELLHLHVVGKFVGYQLYIIEQLIHLGRDGIGSLAYISDCLVFHLRPCLYKQHRRNHRKGQKHPNHQIEKQLLSQSAVHVAAEPFPYVSHSVCPFRQLWSPRYSFGLMPQCFLNTLIKLEASAYPVISAIS